jgi:hypothetical protein
MKIPTNEYGNVDIRQGVPDGLVHLPEARGPLQLRLKGKVEYAKALTDIKSSGGYGGTPVFTGVVVRCEDVAGAQEILSRETKRTRPEPDLLSAIFAVNRAAKRQRDAAQSHYLHGQHGFARLAREKKEYYYRLKDQGIKEAHRLGLLAPVRIHGQLAFYLGQGYSFHSALKPKGIELPTVENDAPITVDSKPQGSKEPRLCDAIALIEAIEASGSNAYERLSVPRIARRTHRRYYRGEGSAIIK